MRLPTKVLSTDKIAPIIPILLGHEHKARIGSMTFEGGRIVVSFPVGGIRQKDIFLIFGDIGYHTLESAVINGERVITKFDILAYSVSTETYCKEQEDK